MQEVRSRKGSQGRHSFPKPPLMRDERDDWSGYQPSTEKENEFIRLHGFAEYAKWHLEMDDEKSEATKGRYKFPYGDFEKVHRCGVLSAESRAGQYKHFDIEGPAATLQGLIDGVKHPTPKQSESTRGFSPPRLSNAQVWLNWSTMKQYSSSAVRTFRVTRSRVPASVQPFLRNGSKQYLKILCTNPIPSGPVLSFATRSSTP
jgi:hypothetical protein